MSEKHTPGPWAYEPGDSIQCGGIWAPARVVCDFIEDPNEADARLIAAAPELLEALQWLVDLMPDPELDIDTVQREQVIKAKAVIAKATNPD